ncbi:uncharacterized protein LOC124255554 [Haliotis rubra]|uniref:uncharacterized protein LOC124255554 n=1 Tax=Haliotis rubra TaxID=36100 RepID=UPI001EE53C3A|nr:uncharacterized protein LOC124255554 [Haliotis rubra]XP_046545451.1 uncharacterized protein LOC124255554 [Haliotis rubra]
MHCTDHTHLPSLDLRKGEGVFICPIQNSTVLLGSHELKMSGMTTFWKSPYNGVVKINSPLTYKHAKALNLSSRRSDDPKQLGLVKSILKNSRSRESESDTSSTDETKKLRGILTKRGDSADTKKRTGKRVKFDDKLVKLHEIGRRYAAQTTGESASGDDVDERSTQIDPPRVLREINGNRQVDDDAGMCSHKAQNPFLKSATTPDLRVGGTSCGFPLQSKQQHPNRLFYERDFRGSSARSENIKVVEYERNAPRERGHPRLCRAYTSPMLYSQKCHRKSAQNLIIYRQELIPDDRHSNRSTKSAGSSSRQRIIIQAPSITSDRSDVSNGSHLNRTNFCNDDKTCQIVRWLRNVNDTQAKEGRCPVLLTMSSHGLRDP